LSALLDINVLLALLDPRHVHHDLAHQWFGERSDPAWATCPITQNGYVRIASQQRYPNPVSCGEAASLLAKFTSQPAHCFWPDAISLLDTSVCDPAKLLTPRQVTDSYLLALAVYNRGVLVTFDTRLVTDAIPLGKAYLLVLG
jgi:uncharacterized protein